MEHHHLGAHLAYDQPGQAAGGMGQASEHTIHYDHQAHGSMSPAMMMMKMYFHFGLGDTLLFESFVLNSAWKMWLASAALFLAALLLEALDYSRGYLSCRCPAGSVAAPSGERHSSASGASSQTQLIGGCGGAGAAGGNGGIRQEPNGGGGGGREQQWSCCSGSLRPDELPDGKAFQPRFFPVRTTDSPMTRALQSSLHFARTALSLGLMLAAMTYNLCLIFPILLGSGLGFYVFYRPALDSKSVMCH